MLQRVVLLSASDWERTSGEWMSKGTDGPCNYRQVCRRYMAKSTLRQKETDVFRSLK